jgi:hypothetical protein
VWLSRDAVWDASDKLLANRFYRSNDYIGAEGSRAQWASAWLPSTTETGAYYIIVRTDDTDAMAESNENNNVIAVPITLTAP